MPSARAALREEIELVSAGLGEAVVVPLRVRLDEVLLLERAQPRLCCAERDAELHRDDLHAHRITTLRSELLEHPQDGSQVLGELVIRRHRTFLLRWAA